jgi:hypothetical protein
LRERGFCFVCCFRMEQLLPAPHLGTAALWIAVSERRRPLPNGRSGGSPVLAQAARLLSGSPDPASPPDRCGTIVAGARVPAFRLERSAHGRYTRYLRLLASQWFQAELVLEVRRRTASTSQGNPPAHRSHGEGENNLGRRTRCRRTFAKARYSCFTADGSQILAPPTRWDLAQTDLSAPLENVRQESCPRDRRLRFLIAVTVRFQVLFVFLVMEVGSRRILHYNVTAHPTADWTLQHCGRRCAHQRRMRIANSWLQQYGVNAWIS